MICTGVDPALGGGFALVTCHLDTQLTILDATVTYDLSKTEEQLSIIADTARRYKPNRLIVEFDAQQKGLGNDDRLRDLSTLCGFTIHPHHTRGQKLDPIFGVASMDQSFKLGLVRIPYGDDATQRRMAPLISQLRAWRPDVKTKNLTQDLVMALWFVHRYWKQLQKAPIIETRAAWRPSWVSDERTYRGIKIA